MYYPEPCHLQPCFSYLGYSKGSLSVTEQTAWTTISLPIYPELSRQEQIYIVSVIDYFLKK
ncbi:MAG: DegT/DnrJ/EryC1/StrS family aminotransferase [Candidatus Omnitrophota bacterium]